MGKMKEFLSGYICRNEGESMKILVLDNDRWVLNGLYRLLEHLEKDLEITTFWSAGEALKYALTEEPMLVIVDVEMPEMSGLEFCHKVREHYNPHIIIISGYDKFQYAQEAIQIGVSNYVLKPINQQEFQNLVSLELEAIREEQRVKKQNRQEIQDPRKLLMIHSYADEIIDVLSVSYCVKDAGPLIDRAFAELGEQSCSLNEIGQFFDELLLLATVNFLAVAGQQEETDKMKLPETRVSLCGTIEEMQRAVLEYLEFICAAMQEQLIYKADAIRHVTDKMLNQDCANVSLDTVASALQIHRNYLSIMFKEKVGINFKDYVLNYKMRKAKQLLQDPSVKMSRIAEELGYMDVKNFSRAFKTYTGLCATDYRNSVYKKPENK